MTGLVLAAALVLCAALGALGILLVLGAGKIARRLTDVDDIEAIADATREPTQPRSASQDIHPVPDEWM